MSHMMELYKNILNLLLTILKEHIEIKDCSQKKKITFISKKKNNFDSGILSLMRVYLNNKKVFLNNK